jgi:hypothetical protein
MFVLLAVPQGLIASLLRKIQAFTYAQYASALNFLAPHTQTFLNSQLESVSQDMSEGF